MLTPEGTAPPNGGTAHVGDRFVLGLWVSGHSHYDAMEQHGYLTFSHALLQNARVDQIGTGCVVTNTISPDISLFDVVWENQVCNGPDPCNFGGTIAEPGSLTYNSTTTSDCPDVGCTNLFRVASVGLCAVAPGRAVLHWQFSPPEPVDRDTRIMDVQGYAVHNPAIFVDYVINIDPAYKSGSAPEDGKK